MTTITKTDARQVISRDQLQQLLPHLSGQELDDLLRSIDSDLSVPCRMDASATPDLVVAVQSNLVSNPVSGRKHSMGHIADVIVAFASGTITFPATSGGNIVPTPGSPVVLTLPSNQYSKVLISLDAFGNLIATPGSADPVEANASVPSPVANTQAIGYIVLFNNAGTIENVEQEDIIQFGGSGGGGGGSTAGISDEASIPFDATELTVVYPTPLAGPDYSLELGWVNEIDADPQHQPLTIVTKDENGFTVKWNAPTDSANYKINFVVPAVQKQVGIVTLPVDAEDVTVTLPIPLSGPNYSVIPIFENLVDVDPDFQPITVTAKTDTTFTVKWNAPTGSANYRLSYTVSVYQ